MLTLGNEGRRGAQGGVGACPVGNRGLWGRGRLSCRERGGAPRAPLC